MNVEAGIEIIWTLHAARRVIQRRFNVEDVLYVIAQGIARGVWGEKRAKLVVNKMAVVAVVQGQRLRVITVTHARGQSRRRNRRK